MTLLCIPARIYFLPKFFENWELCLLDDEEDVIEQWIEAKEESIRNFEAQKDGNATSGNSEASGSEGADENV